MINGKNNFPKELADLEYKSKLQRLRKSLRQIINMMQEMHDKVVDSRYKDFEHIQMKLQCIENNLNEISSKIDELNKRL